MAALILYNQIVDKITEFRKEKVATTGEIGVIRQTKNNAWQPMG